MATAELHQALLNFKAMAEQEENTMSSWRMRNSYNDMARWFNFFTTKTDSCKPLDLIEIVEPEDEIEQGIRMS